jgi:2-keto-3-deoxy-L-fuconate dehydrogenase
MFDLKKKTALVTGAASGIGAAIAEAMASRGAYVYAADLNEESGANVVKAIRAAGGQAEFVRLDVSREEQCLGVASQILASHSDGLDILVNNAGVGCVGTILETAESDMDRLFSVNVKGVYFLSKAVLGPMLKKRNGSIVNLASIGGVVGVKDRFAYCMSKFAVVGMTKSMALDHAADNVRVNCICPGRVETPFVQARIQEYADPAKAYAEMTATQPLGRMAAPFEIAACAVYLASDEAGFVTGSALAIDGGFSAGK